MDGATRQQPKGRKYEENQIASNFPMDYNDINRGSLPSERPRQKPVRLLRRMITIN